MNSLKKADLILNSDGSVFHLHLKPGQVAKNIILVGDPGRVKQVSSFFNSIKLRVENREFVTHTGEYNNKEISVISTGIGTDNIDIVLNELDALFNIDLNQRIPLSKTTTLNFIRIGTSGALQAGIKVGSFLLSEKAIGFDGLLNFYSGATDISDTGFEEAILKDILHEKRFATPYVVKASEKLLDIFSSALTIKGVTASAPGFYAPQGRSLRLSPFHEDLNQSIIEFSYQGQKITNFEMESSAIYGLSGLLGHNAVTICAIIANRITQEYLSDYKPVMDKLIEYTLTHLPE
ncbi:MAG: nucleoside phosphorylase [Bacteroidales bacterium]|nr:nucleoside phosphorylase [Bacteroidales bacterium]